MAAYTNICRQCGRRFTARRVTSRYCGATCRQQAHRNRHQQDRIYETIIQDILRMLDNPRVIEWMKQKNEEYAMEVWQPAHEVQNLGTLHDEGHEQVIPRLLEQLAELREVRV